VENPLAILLEPLRRAIRDAPHVQRLREIPPGATLDGAQLLEAVDSQAAALRRLGVGAGDRVLLHYPNGAALPVAVLACWEAGACCVLARGEAPAAELEHLADLLSPAAVLGFRPPAGDSRAAGALPIWRPARRRAGSARPVPGEAVIKLTSGTLGEPRGIVVTAGQLLAGARQIIETMQIGPLDVNIAAISMTHSYGFDNLLMPLAVQGSPLAVVRSPLPAHLAAALGLSEACVFPGVPYLFDLMCRSSIPWRPAGLRLCISAGAPLPAAVARAFHRLYGLSVHNFYGTTETGGIAFERRPHPGLPEGSVGQPLPGVRVEVEPLQGGDLEEAAGRIVVRSAAVAHSCVPSDAAGGGPGGGRFATGDLGCLDADGRLRLVGRLGLLVNVGGHKVNPAEVERALRALPPVREAVVLAVADRRRGQALAACVESEPGVSRESILESLAGLLPRYKLPRRLLLVRDLPRTERGKPDRARIQDLLGISNPPG